QPVVFSITRFNVLFITSRCESPTSGCGYPAILVATARGSRPSPFKKARVVAQRSIMIQRRLNVIAPFASPDLSAERVREFVYFNVHQVKMLRRMQE
ncbi:hypothetical protein WI666_01685, partial [Vibrio cholerae]